MIYIGDAEKTGNSARSGVKPGSEPSRRFCVAPMMDWINTYILSLKYK
jgi:hypothetical protein